MAHCVNGAADLPKRVGERQNGLRTGHRRIAVRYGHLALASISFSNEHYSAMH